MSDPYSPEAVAILVRQKLTESLPPGLVEQLGGSIEAITQAFVEISTELATLFREAVTEMIAALMDQAMDHPSAATTPGLLMAAKLLKEEVLGE